MVIRLCPLFQICFAESRLKLKSELLTQLFHRAGNYTAGTRGLCGLSVTRGTLKDLGQPKRELQKQSCAIIRLGWQPRQTYQKSARPVQLLVMLAVKAFIPDPLIPSLLPSKQQKSGESMKNSFSENCSKATAL